MAGIRFARIVDQFVADLERLGATVIREASVTATRPARIRVITAASTTDCLLFLWAVTHGGGHSRPANEQRIQITNVAGIPLRPGQRTLLGGWSEQFGVWVFWDARRHVQFSSNSPSLQVSSATLENAGAIGISAYVRPAALGTEVVVAVSSDSLLWYVQNGQPLHNSEDDAKYIESLADASYDDERAFLDSGSNEIVVARRYDLVELMRACRDARFRPAVLRAYRYKCAICRCALKLVDAAHIIPVSEPRSTDEVTNGIALCRLHHGAFDNGLLGVQSNYRVVINPEHEAHLHQLDLDAGIGAFRRMLPEQILLPASIEARPDPMKLIVGMCSRRWPESLIA